MQNLICSRQHRAISGKLVNFLFKYNSRKHGIFNAMSTLVNFNNGENRLCFPLLQRVKNHKELNGVQSLRTKNEFHQIHYFPKLCNTRGFSTTSTIYQQSSKRPNKKPRKPKEFNIFVIKSLTLWFFGTIMFLSFVTIATAYMGIERLEWNEFINEVLLKGQVEEIRIYPRKMEIRLKPYSTYKGQRLAGHLIVDHAPSYHLVEKKIRAVEQNMGIRMEDGVPIKYITMEDQIHVLHTMATISLIFMLIALLSNPKFRSSLGIFGDLSKAKFTLVDPFSGKGVRFKDVAGLKEAKIEVMEFVDYLKNPERYKKLGAKVPKGALLLGPPGCGKTLLAKAVATESNVPFLSMNGSEFIEIVGGLGAARIRNLFAEAKKRAPSIIYIDEIDAIGKKRLDTYAQMSDSESDRTLNQLLVEMDGMTTAQDIIILASTNRANVLDKALLRRGRFDRHILIDLPTLEERIQIFEYHLASLSLEGKPMQYAKYLAHLTPGFSGAEIANVCNEAALHAASEKKHKVDNDDLMYSIDKILGGTIKKSSTLTPSEKKVVVYHEAGHALATWLLEHVNPLIKVTVVPRTNKNLGYAQYSDTNIKLKSFEHLFEHMCVLLGGRVAENIIFNKISSRAQSDLKKVTEMAYHQVQQFGMSPTVGLVSFDKELTTTRTKKPYSKKLASVMDAEVRRIISEAYRKTEKLLLDNKDKLIMLAETLLKKETLTYQDIEALIGPPPFGKKNLTDTSEFNTGLE
ncbi:Spg7 [Anthophora retusa]